MIQGLNTTNYSGEVLENVLTLATTGNELVSKGLIMVIPGVNSSISIPRVKSGKMLQNVRKTRRSRTAKAISHTARKNWYQRT